VPRGTERREGDISVFPFHIHVHDAHVEWSAGGARSCNSRYHLRGARGHQKESMM
jgi:hypothetical protein